MSQSKTWSADRGSTTRRNINTGNTQGAGGAVRLYVGHYGPRQHIGYLRFALDWTDVGKIVSAHINLYTDDGGGELGDTIGSPSVPPHIAVARLTDSFSEHTNGALFNNDDYTSAAYSTTGKRSVDVSKVLGALNTIDITDIVEAWAPSTVKRRNGTAGGKLTNYGVILKGTTSLTNNWACFSEDASGGDVAFRPTITLVYELGVTPPDVPTTLSPDGPVVALTAFEGDFTDAKAEDKLSYSEVEVYTAAASATGQVVTGGSRIYNRKQKESATAVGLGRFNHDPSGLVLVAGVTYKWRSRVHDNEGQVSQWTDLVSFSVTNTAPAPPTLTPLNAASFATLDGVLFKGGPFADDDAADVLGSYQVQLSAYPEDDPHWVDDEFILWNTGRRYTPTGATSWATPYGGASLAAGTYYWRARNWDNRSAASAWAYSSIILTDDFVGVPGGSTSIQQRPKAKWRIRIRDIVDQAAPDVELVQTAAFQSASTLTVAESKWTKVNGGGGTFSFDSNPAAGTLIVAVFITRGLQAYDTTISGWTVAATVGSTLGIRVLYRDAPGGAVGIPEAGTNGTTIQERLIGLIAYNRAGTLVDTAVVSTTHAHGDTMIVGSVDTTDSAALLGIAIGSDPGGGRHTDWTPDSNFDTLVEDTVAGGLTPDNIVGSRTVSAGNYSYAPVVSITGNHAGTPEYDGILCAFQETDPTDPSYAFSADFDAGNTVFAWLTKDGSKPTVPTGFTGINTVRVQRTGSHGWGVLCYKKVIAGEEQDTTFSIPTGTYATFMEWQGVYAGKYRKSSMHAASTLMRCGGALSVPSGVPTAILGVAVAGIADSPSLSVATDVYTSVEVSDHFDGEPLHYVAYRPAESWPSPVNVGGTISNSVKYGGITAAITPRSVSRGPGDIVAIIEDATGVGASTMYNSPGEVHFTLPVDHPQISVLEPRKTHYSVDLYRGGGWQEVFAGLLWDMDATETDVVFYGLDYLGLLDMVLDERYDPANPDKPTTQGGSKYVDKTIAEVISAALDYAIGQPNSPVNFLTKGTIGTMNEKVTIWSTFEPTLSFIAGLIDSHRQGTGKKTRISVFLDTNGQYTVKVEDDPGTDRDNLRLRYGELVQGYRVVPFGNDWASRTNVIGRSRNGLKVHYKSASAPGINQATWGRIGKAIVLNGIDDENDLIRRMKQLTLKNGKLGHSVALGVRIGLLGPLDGYDITDSFPVAIVHGAVNTDNYGSGYWDLYGLLWSVGDKQEQVINLTLFPREDSSSPDDDLIDSNESHSQAEWGLSFEPPDGEGPGPMFYMDVATGIIYRRNESDADDSDGTGGSDFEDEEDA